MFLVLERDSINLRMRRSIFMLLDFVSCRVIAIAGVLKFFLLCLLGGAGWRAFEMEFKDMSLHFFIFKEDVNGDEIVEEEELEIGMTWCLD